MFSTRSCYVGLADYEVMPVLDRKIEGLGRQLSLTTYSAPPKLTVMFIRVFIGILVSVLLIKSVLWHLHLRTQSCYYSITLTPASPSSFPSLLSCTCLNMSVCLCSPHSCDFNQDTSLVRPWFGTIDGAGVFINWWKTEGNFTALL